MALSGLDFSSGIRFTEHVRAKFGTAITPPPCATSFILVVSFSHSLVRLNEDSVALMLQSCLGGLAKDFCVEWLSSWCFNFEVRSKDVGFLIYGSKSFSCKPFAVHNSLWGNGGSKLEERIIHLVGGAIMKGPRSRTRKAMLLWLNLVL
jgi:hypothetical protein